MASHPALPPQYPAFHAQAKAAAAGLQVPTGVGSGLVSHDFWSSREHKLSLPELVLTGPIELVLAEPQPVSMFLPHAADVGIVRRVLLQPGATIKVRERGTVAWLCVLGTRPCQSLSAGWVSGVLCAATDNGLDGEHFQFTPST